MNEKSYTLAFVLNLAICDFLYCSSTLTIYGIQNLLQKPILSETMCIMDAILRTLVVYAEYFSIAMIAVARCMNLKDIKLKGIYVKTLLISVWSAAILILVPQMIHVTIIVPISFS